MLKLSALSAIEKKEKLNTLGLNTTSKHVERKVSNPSSCLKPNVVDSVRIWQKNYIQYTGSYLEVDKDLKTFLEVKNVKTHLKVLEMIFSLLEF